MFTYQQNKCAECLPCTVEVFKGLTQAPATAKKIDEVRRLNACGQVAEAKALKGTLPGLLFQTREVLVSEGKAKYNKGMKGRWRLQAQCVLNGLVMCDFDHVGNPREVVERWGLLGTDLHGFINKDTALSAEENSVSQNESRVDPCLKNIVLVFITPSGEGLKVVFKADPELNLVDNQLQMGKRLGLALKIDKGCKDSSRLSFIPKWDDILFMNEQELFNYDNPLYDKKFGKRYREGNSQSTIDFAEDGAGKSDQGAGVSQEPALGEVMLDRDENGTYCYHGVPYTDIVAKWNELKGGRPTPEGRVQKTR